MPRTICFLWLTTPEYNYLILPNLPHCFMTTHSSQAQKRIHRFTSSGLHFLMKAFMSCKTYSINLYAFLLLTCLSEFTEPVKDPKRVMKNFFLPCCCCWIVSDSLWTHGLQHARLPCPSLSLAVCSNSCPFSRRCYLTISSSVAPFSPCPQSFSASGSFPMSWLFTSGGQRTGASA